MARLTAWTLLVTVIFTPAHLYGQAVIDPNTLRLQNIMIEGSVAQDSSTNIFTYRYNVTNPSTNIGKAWLLEIDIKKPENSASVSSEGLVNGEDFLGGEDIFADPLTPAMMPVGVPTNPSGWVSGLTILGRVLWGASNPSVFVVPGGANGDFTITSHGLPTIRGMIVHPRLDVESLPESFSEVDIKAMKDLRSEIAFHGRTLGPTAPPAVFDALAFIQTIRGYITESQTLNWVIDPVLAATLNGYLNAVVDAINTSDIATAKLHLEAFINALPVPPAGTPACTSECSGLLVFNAQYLLSQLDSLPDLVVNKIVSDGFTIIPPGGLLNIDVDVKNFGVGSAGPSTLGFFLSSNASPTEIALDDFSVNSLGVGETQSFFNLHPTVPLTISSGPYTVRACANATGALAELSKSNNCREADNEIFVAPFATNDFIATATPITTFPFNDTIYTGAASTSSDDPIESCLLTPSSKTVWYRITAPADGSRNTASGFPLSSFLRGHQGRGHRNGRTKQLSCDADRAYHGVLFGTPIEKGQMF